MIKWTSFFMMFLFFNMGSPKNREAFWGKIKALVIQSTIYIGFPLANLHEYRQNKNDQDWYNLIILILVYSGFLFNLLGIGVPPGNAASIRAKFPCFFLAFIRRDPVVFAEQPPFTADISLCPLRDSFCSRDDAYCQTNVHKLIKQFLCKEGC